MANQISWTLDASLEAFEPGFVHTEKQERQMQIGVSLKSAAEPESSDVRIDMRLNCIISVADKPCCIAEVSAASIAEKALFEKDPAQVNEVLYQHVKENLRESLQSAFYMPPLPEKLSDIHQ